MSKETDFSAKIAKILEVKKGEKSENGARILMSDLINQIKHLPPEERSRSLQKILEAMERGILKIDKKNKKSYLIHIAKKED